MGTVNFESIKKIADEQCPVYSKYDTQINAQPAYIEMEEDGTISADYSGDIGDSTPSAVWHGVTRQWSISPTLSGADILSLVEDNLALFQRVHDGHAVEWDGSNFVGSLDDDAQEASDEIELIASEAESSVAVYTAYAWIFANGDNPMKDVWPDNVSLQDAADTVERCWKRNLH